MEIENKNLSMVLSGRINDYHIYRLREDGGLKCNIRQPLVKSAFCLNESEMSVEYNDKKKLTILRE